MFEVGQTFVEINRQDNRGFLFGSKINRLTYQVSGFNKSLTAGSIWWKRKNERGLENAQVKEILENTLSLYIQMAASLRQEAGSSAINTAEEESLLSRETWLPRCGE